MVSGGAQDGSQLRDILTAMDAIRWTDSVLYHGEGPIWWPRLAQLRCVDMLAGDVLTFADDGEPTRTATGSPVAACLRPRATGGAILAGEREVWLADRDDLTDLRRCSADLVPAGVRFNDGGCDLAGRFYCGTMAYDRTPGAGALYRIDPHAGSAEVVHAPVTISNGLAWCPINQVAYYIDTVTRTIFKTDPDVLDLVPFVTVPETDFWPDGLCLAADGGVWVALNGAGKVVRYNTQGIRDAEIQVAAAQVTACTFGGPDLTTLYITTSRENLPDDADPQAGSVFVAPGVDQGLPGAQFGT